MRISLESFSSVAFREAENHDSHCPFPVRNPSRRTKLVGFVILSRRRKFVMIEGSLQSDARNPVRRIIVVDNNNVSNIIMEEPSEAIWAKGCSAALPICRQTNRRIANGLKHRTRSSDRGITNHFLRSFRGATVRQNEKPSKEHRNVEKAIEDTSPSLHSRRGR